MTSFSNSITTAAQLHQAETATYMADAIIGVLFIFLILIVIQMIPWQPGSNDPSPRKRRLWFWILGAVTLVVNLGVNYYNWMRHITKAQFVSEYTIHMIIAAIVGVIIYLVITFAICKLQKAENKLASVFK